MAPMYQNSRVQTRWPLTYSYVSFASGTHVRTESCTDRGVDGLPRASNNEERTGRYFLSVLTTHYAAF